MNPGEFQIKEGVIELNVGRQTLNFGGKYGRQANPGGVALSFF